MVCIYDNFFQGLEWRVTDKSGADHTFKPGPFAFGANSGVDADEAPSCLDKAHESDLLGIGIEDIVVGVGEDERVISFQVFVGEVGRSIGNIDFKTVCEGELANTGHGSGDVLMDVAFSVTGVDEDTDVLPGEVGSERMATVGIEQWAVGS